MRIENLRYQDDEKIMKVMATIIWEDYERTPIDLFFATDIEFSDSLSCNPHAFLVACIIPALYFGEKRVYIDAEICPELKDGLRTVMNIFKLWYPRYYSNNRLVQIESKIKGKIKIKQPRAGFLFSGGIDSLATLRYNRLNYPLEHPCSIKDGLLVDGLEIRDTKIYKYVWNSVSALAKDSNVTLIPAYTNVRELGPDNSREFWEDFWIHEYMGAAFSAIAHAFSRHFTTFSINSCHDIANLIPYSSHPLIDPNYSSFDLQIRHEGITLSRFEKTKLIAGWERALQYLRVCNRTEYYSSEILNCGKCEKCVRTMLALEALNVLERASAFPVNKVTEELVDEAVQLSPNIVPLYGELLLPLKESGRIDLARAIERKIKEFHKPQWIKEWKKRPLWPIIEFDKRYLKGNLRRIKHHIIPKNSPSCF